MFLLLLLVFASTLDLIAADIRFLAPAAGSITHGDGAVSVSWEESGAAPSMSDLISYQLFLCAGGNEDSSIVQLYGIVLDGKFAITGNSAEAVIPSSIGASSPENAYFLKMISVAVKGGTVVNYSHRFSMSEMTGTFPPNVAAGLETVSGTDGPPSVNNVADGGGHGGTAINALNENLYSTPFADQSGPLRYASMQRVPPTKITKRSRKPINPTSPYTVATTFLPPVTSILSTATEPGTWSYSQAEHTGTPAAMPYDDMQKFLNRWKD